MTFSSQKALNNCTVLITRPQKQNTLLQKEISQHGGNALCFPTIEILPPKDIAAMKALCLQWHAFDRIIFLSANAVQHATPYLSREPQKNTILAIGPGTAQALIEQQIKVTTIAQEYSSEGLLDLDLLQSIAGKKILIFCGENSPPYFQETLQKRGATVALALCYRRCFPKQLAIPINELKRQSIDIIVTTSMETLTNLYAIIAEENHHWLDQQTLLVIKPAMSEWARQQFRRQRVIVSPNASTEAILNTLINWYTKRKSL